tara:strand:+ start:734 stop:1024 length:291 start_codon:yes stop_codon:yes gene_type:complete
MNADITNAVRFPNHRPQHANSQHEKAVTILNDDGLSAIKRSLLARIGLFSAIFNVVACLFHVLANTFNSVARSSCQQCSQRQGGLDGIIHDQTFLP